MTSAFHQIQNSSGTLGYNARRFGGNGFGAHFHQNMELIVCLDGKMEVTVGRCEHFLREGDCCMVLPNQIHQFDAQNAKCWICVFSAEYVPIFADQIRGKEPESPVFRLGESVAAVMKEKLMDAQSSALVRQGTLSLICAEMYADTAWHLRPVTGSAAVRAFDYVSEHFREDLTNERVAAALGYESHYLSRCVSATFQMNFRRILNRMRCEEAQKLLSKGKSVTEACFESGFQSMRTFHSAFTENCGCRPGEWRRKNGANPSEYRENTR